MRTLFRGIALAACILHATAARSDNAGIGTLNAPEGSAQPAETSRPKATACRADMIEVEGSYCPFLDQTCIKRPQVMSYRCAEYRAPSGSCQTGTAQKHFCIDKYEWPNKAGDTPVVMKNWYEARDACQGVGKRLCTEDEWTLACEGPEHLPYPYGYARDANACNIDKPAIQFDENALKRPDKRDAEAARLWQGEPSGAREKCVSPFGVHDMTGNVDEWTLNETGKPHNSALKGGWWSWVRGRCRAVTEGHEEGFRYYQIGWRCCANPSASGGEKRSAPPIATPAPIAPAPIALPPIAPAPIALPPVMPEPKKPRAVTIAPPVADEAPRDDLRGREKGAIVVGSSAAGHRIFVDERIVGTSPATITMFCGKHTVRIGHDGRDQTVEVPCGGRVAVAYP